jgi:hypothetical protein
MALIAGTPWISAPSAKLIWMRLLVDARAPIEARARRPAITHSRDLKLRMVGSPSSGRRVRSVWWLV